MILKSSIYVPNKDFKGKGDVKEIIIKIKEPNKNGDVLFEGDLPSHVFDKLKDTADIYKTKENGGLFRKKISLSNYKHLLESIQAYCYDAEKIQELEKLEKQKKIFIQFNFSNKGTRDEWCGAFTGNLINTNFRYFVGYKTSLKRVKLGSSWENGKAEESDCIKYLSEYWSATDTKNYKKGSLQPLNRDWEHKNIERQFKIINWTQEREDFLSEISERFNTLGTKLNDFLGDLDSDKLDHLIKNNLKLLY